MKPLVAVDADVLGRRRTGDETYVERLLDALPRVEDGLRFAAITRRPELVPNGVTPVELRARFQETRMAIGVPRLLRRLEPDLVHFVHALPPARDCSLARALVERGADVRGFVSKDELAELYRGAAVFVFPTRYEGFGLPVLEAMASGTPVVAAPDAAVREVAGDAAVYAEPGELAAAVMQALAE